MSASTASAGNTSSNSQLEHLVGFGLARLVVPAQPQLERRFRRRTAPARDPRLDLHRALFAALRAFVPDAPLPRARRRLTRGGAPLLALEPFARPCNNSCRGAIVDHVPNLHPREFRPRAVWHGDGQHCVCRFEVERRRPRVDRDLRRAAQARRRCRRPRCATTAFACTMWWRTTSRSASPSSSARIRRCMNSVAPNFTHADAQSMRPRATSIRRDSARSSPTPPSMTASAAGPARRRWRCRPGSRCDARGRARQDRRRCRRR